MTLGSYAHIIMSPPHNKSMCAHSRGGECPLPPSPSCMIVKVPKRVDIYTKIMIKSKFNVWEVWWFFIISIISNSFRKPRLCLRSYFKGPKIDFLYVRKSHWNDLRSLAPSKCYLVVILQWLMYIFEAFKLLSLTKVLLF